MKRDDLSTTTIQSLFFSSIKRQTLGTLSREAVRADMQVGA